jgi:hypothetical protein
MFSDDDFTRARTACRVTRSSAPPASYGVADSTSNASAVAISGAPLREGAGAQEFCGITRRAAARAHDRAVVVCGREVEVRIMRNYWSGHLPDLLADNGTIAAYSPRGLRLGKYWTEIVGQASNYEAPTTLRCRRRPRRRPCGALPRSSSIPTTSMCCGFVPLAMTTGRISGWEGTFWDNSDIGEEAS